MEFFSKIRSVLKENATTCIVLITIACTLFVNHMVKGDILLMGIYAVIAILATLFAGKVCKFIANLFKEIKKAIEVRKAKKANKKQLKNGVKAILAVLLLIAIFGVFKALFPAKEEPKTIVNTDDTVIVDPNTVKEESSTTDNKESESSKPVVPSTREYKVPENKKISTTTESQKAPETKTTTGTTTNDVTVADNSDTKQEAIEKAEEKGETVIELNKGVIVGVVEDDEEVEAPVAETEKKLDREDKNVKVLPQTEEEAPNATITEEKDETKDFVADDDAEELNKLISENLKTETSTEAKVADTTPEVEEPKEEVIVTKEVVNINDEAEGFNGVKAIEEPKVEEKVEEEVVVAKEEVKAPTVSSNTINAFTGDTVQFTFSGENVKVSGADNISVVGNTVSFQAGDEATVYEIEVANEAGSQTVIVVVSSPFNN